MLSIVRYLYFLCCLTLSISSLAKPEEHLQLAKNFSFDKNTIPLNEYWVSEKLDGIRGYWTGTQMLSKQGNPIQIPVWFTINWPKTPLDGEFWIGRSKFQEALSCVTNKSDSDLCWMNVTYKIFDLPDRLEPFSKRIQAMSEIVKQTNNPTLSTITQIRIKDYNELEQKLSQVTIEHGEGLMLHHQNALYRSGRVNHLLKVKQKHDAEAKVIATVKGKGKYSGMMGAIEVETAEGLVFKIGTGFSDKERKNPPAIGSIITYQYIGKTKRGIPRFASYLRIKEKEI